MRLASRTPLMERRKFFLDAVAGLDIIKPAILAPAVRLVINRRIKERNMSVRKVSVAMVLVMAAVTAAYGEPLVEVREGTEFLIGNGEAHLYEVIPEYGR